MTFIIQRYLLSLWRVLDTSKKRKQQEHSEHLCTNCGLGKKGNGHKRTGCPFPANPDLVQLNKAEKERRRREARSAASNQAST